jgi:hypothetical protein
MDADDCRIVIIVALFALIQFGGILNECKNQSIINKLYLYCFAAHSMQAKCADVNDILRDLNPNVFFLI